MISPQTPIHPPKVVRSMQTVLALWDELRRLPGPHLFVMRGVSMWPAIPDGSILGVRPCEARHLVKGDLVTFRQSGRIVTHRTVKVTPEGTVITWGDAVMAPDPPIEAADILGATELIDRGSRRRTAGVRLVLRRIGAGLVRRFRRTP